MNEHNILETFKKHLGELGNISETPSGIYNFGENMKGMNEFIGAAQTLSLNLVKIRHLGEKIQCIDDLIKSENSDAGALDAQKGAHISNIKYILEGTQFMGVKLFGTQLSCAISGMIFELYVENPLEHANDDMIGYCTQKIDEISGILQNVSAALNSGNESAFDAKSSHASAHVQRLIK